MNNGNIGSNHFRALAAHTGDVNSGNLSTNLGPVSAACYMGCDLLRPNEA